LKWFSNDLSIREKVNLILQIQFKFIKLIKISCLTFYTLSSEFTLMNKPMALNEPMSYNEQSILSKNWKAMKISLQSLFNWI
jgi:hypothetical protein